MNKILLIEDDTALNENLGFILGKNNFSLMTAENGKTGIELANNNKVDAVVCDVMLPDIDGYKVIDSIKKNESYKNVPFLFISAKSTATDIEKGMVLGAYDYLVKPFKANLLVKSLNTVLNKKALNNGNILLIGKDSYYSNELALILEKKCYNCHISFNENSVLELAEINKIDLIIYNIEINNNDSYSVVKKIKDNITTQNIPLIILSEKFNSIFFKKLINKEKDNYLVKPVEFEEIIRAITLKIPTIKSAEKDKLNIIDNYQLPGKRMNYHLNEHTLPKYNNNPITKINFHDEIKEQLVKPSPAIDSGYNSDNTILNNFLSGRNIARDYEQFVHQGLLIVLVNLNRADYKESLNFQKHLLEIMKLNIDRILVDMSSAVFIDSAFAGALINVGRRLNGEIRIVINSKNSTTNPFLINQLEKQFTTYENLNIAINCFNTQVKQREARVANL